MGGRERQKKRKAGRKEGKIKQILATRKKCRDV